MTENNKHLFKAYCAQLVNACKQKKDKPAMLQKACELLDMGADVNCASGRPMYFAVKNYNFRLIRLLMSRGALDNENSVRHLAGMCERGGFNPRREEAFFELIDYAVSQKGFDIAYLVPYINAALLAGRPDAVYSAAEKYGMDLEEAAFAVGQRAIFELVNLGLSESLDFVNSYRDWMSSAVDAAVAAGENKVLSYMVLQRQNMVPSRESIVRAISGGHTGTLKFLDGLGLSLNDEAFFAAAVRAFPWHPGPLDYLLEKHVAGDREILIKRLLKTAVEEHAEPLYNHLKNKLMD